MSESARTWGLRLLALAISVAVWYSVSLSDRETTSEITVDQASVSYGVPRGYVLIDPVRTVRVRLRGTDKRIRQLDPQLVKVQVEMPESRVGEFNFDLGPDDVRAPEEYEVVAIDPNVIRVEMDREITQRIPVKAQLTGEPAAGAQAGEPEAIPNQILVVGPESLISKIESLSTRPVSLDGHAADFEETVAVIPPENPLVQVIQTSRVTVRVPVEPPQTAGDAADAADADTERDRQKESS